MKVNRDSSGIGRQPVRLRLVVTSLVATTALAGVAVLTSCASGPSDSAPANTSSSTSTAGTSSEAGAAEPPVACTAETTTNAPPLTYEVASTLIGSRPWLCAADGPDATLAASQRPDSSTSTEEWMRALSTDVDLPEGFQVDDSVQAYIAADGVWYSVRYAGEDTSEFPLKVSPTTDPS